MQPAVGRQSETWNRSELALTISNSLAAVNFCLAIVGTIQVSRILLHNASRTGSKEEAVKEMGRDMKGQAIALENKAENELKALKN